ncbi:hypothetical protein SAMN05446635_10061 [Burkholderia sp. OK233]|jgi:transposase-like protein|nr:hypothetical protein SAMN05446635_10061 [Burkholderia sp. OK233]
MKKSKSLYCGHCFPAGVISCTVRWYFRFQLSLRDIEELLPERGVIVAYETIRCWCAKCGTSVAHREKAVRCKPGSTWYPDEMFVTLRGEPYLLWRAVDEHGAELDILLRTHRYRCRTGPVRQVGNALSGIHHRQVRFPACLRSSHSLHAWCGLSIWPRFSLY